MTNTTIPKRERVFKLVGYGITCLLLLCIIVFSWTDLSYIVFGRSLDELGFVLPLFVTAWIIFTLFFGGARLLQSKRSGDERFARSGRESLSLGGLTLLVSLVAWPPSWLARKIFHRPDTQLTQVTPKHRLHLMSWNVQTMGVLVPNPSDSGIKRSQLIRESRRCVHETIKRIEREAGASLDIFAFQEVTNTGLQALESALNLRCQFISYKAGPKVKTSKTGLGICDRDGGAWRLNYARNIVMHGDGNWRALFSEVSSTQASNLTFNLMNVHFKAHGLEDIKHKVAALDFDEVLSQIAKTSKKQRIQADGLLSIIKHYHDPTLMMGDFNAPPHVGAHPLLQNEWTDVWRASGSTFGATRYLNPFLFFRVDFIYSKRDTFNLVDSRVTSSDCSDHLPLSARLILP